jgi:hypothetical protein
VSARVSPRRPAAAGTPRPTTVAWAGSAARPA